MRTREDIEAYLSRSGHPHKELADDTWLVSDPSDARDNIVVGITEGLVIFRLKVLELAKVDEGSAPSSSKRSFGSTPTTWSTGPTALPATIS